MVEPGGQILPMRRDAEAALDEVLPHRRVPTAGSITRRLGARCAQGGQRSALRWGSCARSPWWACVHQTRDALEEKGVAIVAQGLLAQVEHRGNLLNALVVSQREQGLDTPDHSQIATAIGVLQPAIALLACKGAEV